MTILAPGDTIGILGGGQLARMLAVAAAQLGLETHIYAPERDSPAFAVAGAHTIARYDDEAALGAFARTVQVVTYEFENVPAETAAILGAVRPVRPNGRVLAMTQDRLFEKTFLRGLGLPTAPFAAVADVGDLDRAVAAIGRPAILKTRRLGYDGKGQVAVRVETSAATAFDQLGQPAILEGFVPFSREVSVVGARALDGRFRAYDVCENGHEGGILRTTRLPAAIQPETEAAAIRMAQQIADALDYVGVIAVEAFVVAEQSATSGERLVINELAPRVHNSGHWTLGGAVTSQFEQHIRAIAGWPLGSTRRLGGIAMRNLIGAEAENWRDILATEGASLHLYGKRETRPGRKMGHVTAVLAEEPPSGDPL